MFVRTRIGKLCSLLPASLLLLAAYGGLAGQEIPSVLVSIVKGVRMDVSGDGQFVQDFPLETPLSLAGVSLIHWERTSFQIRQESVPAGSFYGSRFDVALLSAGVPVTASTSPESIIGMGPSFTSTTHLGSWPVSGYPTAIVDQIRFTITTPTDLVFPPIVCASGSGAILHGLGEDDSITLRFIVGESGPEGPNIVRSVSGLQAVTASGGPGPWSNHTFEAPVPTRGLRFVAHGWLGIAGGECGGMIESQLLLDGHTEESPAIIALDDAYSPSRGEPAPFEVICRNSRELLPGDHEEIAGRQIVGWRWRVNVLPGCEMTGRPGLSPIDLHFAYDFGVDNCLAAPGMELQAPEGEAPVHLVAKAVDSDVPEGVGATYSWDFGDGETAEGVEADHVYSRAGRYYLELSRSSSCGLTRTVRRAVLVNAAPGGVSPWTSSSIGEPALTGGAAMAGHGCLRVTAGGNLIAALSQRDACHFVHQEFRGDGALVARFTSADAPSSGAQFGLMVREGLDPASRNAALTVRVFSGDEYPYRSYRREGQTRLRSVARPQGWSWPDQALWIRLERSGSTVEAFLRPDGGPWTSAGIVDFEEDGGAPLADSLLYGIVAIGNDPGPGAAFEALDLTVCDAAVTPALPPRFLRGDCSGDGDTGGVTDAVVFLGYNFLGWSKPPCLAACDANGDGSLGGVSDAIYFLSYNFLGGTAPPAPFPACGPGDSGGDVSLGCTTPPESCR